MPLRLWLVRGASSAVLTTFSPTRLPPPSLLRSSSRPRSEISSSYGLFVAGGCARRHMHLNIPTFFLPPVIFTGLLLALYTWKSFVMVSLQNKIIYCPYLPPSARFDKISDYQHRHHGIEWKELHMRSIDGTDLALAVTTVSSEPSTPIDDGAISSHVYILFCQGNAASLPCRLQDHSWILREVKKTFGKEYSEYGKVRFTEVGLSYRGYWTSAGSPSEIGINYDTTAAVKWISQLHDNTYPKNEHGVHVTKPIFIIWGQSIGCGFATNLTAAGVIPAHLEPSALILETPFLSIKEMLGELYPQKWLPYKYLHPFLRNFLDSHRNLGTIAAAREQKQIPPPNILILQAGKDEIVPERHTKELKGRCHELNIPVETFLCPRAFHNDVIDYGRGRIARFIMEQTARAINSSPSQRGTQTTEQQGSTSADT